MDNDINPKFDKINIEKKSLPFLFDNTPKSLTRQYDMILEVRTVHHDAEVNELLTGNWILLWAEIGVYVLGRVALEQVPYRHLRPNAK